MDSNLNDQIFEDRKILKNINREATQKEIERELGIPTKDTSNMLQCQGIHRNKQKKANDEELYDTNENCQGSLKRVSPFIYKEEFDLLCKHHDKIQLGKDKFNL